MVMTLTDPGWHSVFTARLLQGIAWLPGYLFFRVFFRLHINGRENLKKALALRMPGQGIIFAANHISEFDPEMVLTGIHPFSPLSPMFYVAKQVGGYRDKGWRGKYLYDGTMVALWGGYPITAGTGDYAQSLTRHVALLSRGRSMCIFPTGRVHTFDTPMPVRGGLGYLIEATHPLVIPVRIDGPYKPSARKIFTRAFDTTITYGEPRQGAAYIDSSLPVPERYQKAAERVFETIRTLS